MERWLTAARLKSKLRKLDLPLMGGLYCLDVALRERCDVFAAFIYQVAQRFEAEHGELFVERVDFAHRWNVGNHPAKHLEISFKGAVGRNEGDDAVSGLWIFDGNVFDFALNRLQDVDRLLTFDLREIHNQRVVNNSEFCSESGK